MKSSLERRNGVEILILAVVFFLVGGLIGASAYVAYLPVRLRLMIRIGMPIATLVGWLLSARNERYQKYQGLAAGFFAVSSGLLLTNYVGPLPTKWLDLPPTTIKGIAVAKFSESLPIILSILVLHFALGGKASGLFLTGERSKFGLISGGIGVLVLLGIAVLQAFGLGLTWSKIAPEIPWILVFVLSNAFLEELWFRGLFLKKLEPLTGRAAAIMLTSLVFGLVHISSTYVIDLLMFVGLTMALGVLWSWLMFKTNSIWPAVMIHAAADVLIMIGFLA